MRFAVAKRLTAAVKSQPFVVRVRGKIWDWRWEMDLSLNNNAADILRGIHFLTLFPITHSYIP